MPPQMQPQAQPQAPQMAPSSPAPAPQAQAGQPPQEKGATPQQDPNAIDPRALQLIEQHLNSLPDEQKQYLGQYLTPELAVLFGIVLGNDAYNYFKQYVDPNKQLTVTAREGQQNPQQPQQAPQGPVNPVQQQVPAQSIMGQ